MKNLTYIRKSELFKLNLFSKNTFKSFSIDYSYVQKEIKKFNPNIPIEEAVTPPSSWYTSKGFYNYEVEKVFKNNWIGIQSNQGLEKINDYITGEIIGQPYILVRNSEEKINAFYNVCSHHAARVASGCGSCEQFVCPYHGWTYNNQGNLIKSTSMKGIKNFKPKNYGLKNINTETFSNFLFFNFRGQSNFKDLVLPLVKELENFEFDPTFSDLKFVKAKEYHIKSNWKVFVDNYCDGGYHVPYAHKNLNQNLDLSTYNNLIFDKLSIQTTKSRNSDKRIGDGAVYAFIYPNIMLNRYGPWLDTNIVIPINEEECLVRIEWFIEKAFESDIKFIEESLNSSEEVQFEDVFLCETVMKGLKSDAYDVGRYVPSKEGPAYKFHQDLYDDLLRD